MKLPPRTRWIFIIAGFTVVAGLAILHWPVSIPEFAEVQKRFIPSEAYLLDRHGDVIDSQRINFGIRRFLWVDLQQVSPALIDAVIAGEDQRFWKHGGVDWRSVFGAVRDQIVYQRRRGASTITMQVASLVENNPRSRSGFSAWRRKLRQVQVAYALESHWTKQQILEAYLNLLDFRGELQGIGAATEVLVHKTPSGLNTAESLVLAALLPNPTATSERLSARACARAQANLSLGVTCEAINNATNALLNRTSNRLSVERLAPQLTRSLLKKAGQRVQTTLDAPIQRLATDILSQQLSELADHNARDGAVLVIDNATAEVLAYVGSAGPNSQAAQVDGARAPRQAGSTLKPFLYGLAIERRYLTAASLLDDSPVRLDTASGTYIPQNYEPDFKGLVSVRTALGNSLNIPAIRTLVLVSVEAFRNRLHDLGYAGLTESGDFYGYSLALGSAEVTLWEQAQAYRTIARGGQWSPLKILEDETETSSSKTVFPEDAAFIIGNILSDRTARSLTFGMDNHLNTPFWSAVKTGTSKDMRDNWCIGFSQQYTVAVWVGNFEGDSMYDVSGITGAAPVWHNIMLALHQNLPSLPPQPPKGVTYHSTAFSPPVEATRQEWFLVDTITSKIEVMTSGEIARISNPSNGLIIALDPDIPESQQRVLITTKGARSDMNLILDGTRLGSAIESILWKPTIGAHRLVLQDTQGKIIDRILFTVR